MIIKKTKFKIDLYGATVHITLCKNADVMLEEANKVIKKFGEEIMDHPAEGISFTPNTKGNYYFLFFCPEYLSINTITHETDHIRNYMMDYYGINENNDSKEVSANLNGYINQKVFKFLNTNSQIKF